jgi:starvation-inducible DNA-binding protein
MAAGTHPGTHKAHGETHSDGRRVVKEAFPAPPQLATPTDLTSQQVQAIVAALNPLVADHFALYVKTKNFHWHLAGSHFREYHKLFDNHAEFLFAAIDVLAERVRRIGGTTIRSIGHISQLQTIADDNDAYVAPGDMARRLMEDSTRLTKSMRAAHEVCERNRDVATTSILENLIDEAERRTWFLFEVTQGGENTK